jgi:hypothetical protein
MAAGDRSALPGEAADRLLGAKRQARLAISLAPGLHASTSDAGRYSVPSVGIGQERGVAVDGQALVDKLREDELRSIANDVSTGLRDQILKALDERGRAQELVRQQYSGRYPFELLQNANDASADRDGSRVVFAVTDNALVVADEGLGFGPDQIRAICGLGRSSKDPRKSIGYKGLGFKSVGEISDHPQIISTGVAFGFDDVWTQQAVESLAGPLDPGQRLPVYAFPFPLDSTDLGPEAELIADLQQRGFTTILRLPFRSGVTRATVAQQVRDTITARLLLFLDATESLEVIGIDSDFSAEIVRAESDGCIETLLQVGDRTEHWLVFQRTLADLDRTLVDGLGDGWKLVEKVQVSAAVPLDNQGHPAHAAPEPLHVYFPTEESTGLSIVLQGDFALELDRRHVARTPEMLPYNQWLGGQLAMLIGEVAESLARRFSGDPATVRAFAPAGVASGFGELLSAGVMETLGHTAFIPVVGGDVRSPREAVLLPPSIGQPGMAHRFLDLSEHPAVVVPAVESHQPSRRLLVDLLKTSELTTEATLQLVAEPRPTDDASFYELLVNWAEKEGMRRFAGRLAKVACVRTLGGGWVSPASGVFFPRQREEVEFPEGLQVPIIAVPEVDGLRPLLEAAGVRPFEWRLLIPDFVLPLLMNADLDQNTRRAALVALRGYYETERTGDPRMRGLIAKALMPARDAAGTVTDMRPAGSLYFSGAWLGHDRLERIYGPFGQVEFLAIDPPPEHEPRKTEHAFYEWMGVGAHPRVDERRADQRDLYPLNNLIRHPHRVYGALWTNWQADPEVRGKATCDQGHTTAQQLRVSFALDRFPELAAAKDHDRLVLLWRELCTDWSRYEQAFTAELQCNHGWHSGDSVRTVPSLLQYMLRHVPWVSCVRGRQRTVVVPSRAWRITADTPPRIVERVDVLDPALDVRGSALVVAVLGVVDAARPAPENLVVLLRDLRRTFEEPSTGDSRDLQLAARWAMRTLNDSIESGHLVEGPVPLLARLVGRHVFSEAPFVANDPLLAETWEPVFPVLDADRDLRRLHDALQLRDLDEEVETVPDPRRPRPDLRLAVDGWITEAKPFLAAVAIDQVPSRQSDVVRGLARLEVSVCEDFVLRYVLDGEVRERDEAVSYIAVRVEQEGPIIRRRIGTAHLELDPRTHAPHWYAFGPQLAQFLGVPNLGDAFALLLAADKTERQQYLAARRISLASVDEARLELAQPDSDEIIEDLLHVGDEGQEAETPSAPTSASAEATATAATETTATERGGERAAEAELPDIDYGSLTIEESPIPPPRGAEGRRPRMRQPGLGSGGPVDHDAMQRLQRRIGRRGERAVYEAERRRLVALGRDPALVVWRSRDQEYAPYDIESQDHDGQHIYIEVKSTTSDDPSDPFEISEMELLFGIQKRSSYYIYRVTSAHTATPAIKRYRDPVGRLHDNTARLRLSGARLTFMADEEPVDLNEPSVAPQISTGETA